VSDLEALALRCEQATGADREIEAPIDALLGWRRVDNPTFAGGLIDMWHSPDGRICRRDERLHEYTASLDAAMTLAKGKRVILNIAEDGMTVAIVDGTQGCAATPALALTAACLRARSQVQS
jgi:hypothetical protein